MFGQKAKNTIDSLIGTSTTIEGNLRFKQRQVRTQAIVQARAK